MNGVALGVRDAAKSSATTVSLVDGAPRKVAKGPFSLTRHSKDPILLPDLSSWWECNNVFNPSVIYHNGVFHMHYRAQGTDWVSRIGYAVSTDGVHFNRLREPVLVPETDMELKGVEDPRVTYIDGMFYMAYTGFSLYNGQGPNYPGSIYPLFARSTNLIKWERMGPMVRGEDNKDHMLFPRKFNGKYCAFHRRRPNVWLAFSKDLHTWLESDMREMCQGRENVEWEGKYIGMNGVPIETDEGWLAFYHGADPRHVYRIGVMLLDKDEPWKILARPTEPVLWPEMMWELRGDVNNVVFSSTNILIGDTVYVYYGGADHAIGLATAKLTDLLDFVRKG